MAMLEIRKKEPRITRTVVEMSTIIIGNRARGVSQDFPVDLSFVGDRTSMAKNVFLLIHFILAKESQFVTVMIPARQNLTGECAGIKVSLSSNYPHSVARALVEKGLKNSVQGPPVRKALEVRRYSIYR